MEEQSSSSLDDVFENVIAAIDRLEKDRARLARRLTHADRILEGISLIPTVVGRYLENRRADAEEDLRPIVGGPSAGPENPRKTVPHPEGDAQRGSSGPILSPRAQEICEDLDDQIREQMGKIWAMIAGAVLLGIGIALGLLFDHLTTWIGWPK